MQTVFRSKGSGLRRTDCSITRRISQAYERITGRKCETQEFVVRKDSIIGCYYVHLLGTTWFYEFNIRENSSETVIGPGVEGYVRNGE